MLTCGQRAGGRTDGGGGRVERRVKRQQRRAEPIRSKRHISLCNPHTGVIINPRGPLESRTDSLLIAGRSAASATSPLRQQAACPFARLGHEPFKHELAEDEALEKLPEGPLEAHKDAHDEQAEDCTGGAEGDHPAAQEAAGGLGQQQ